MGHDVGHARISAANLPCAFPGCAACHHLGREETAEQIPRRKAEQPQKYPISPAHCQAPSSFLYSIGAHCAV